MADAGAAPKRAKPNDEQDDDHSETEEDELDWQAAAEQEEDDEEDDEDDGDDNAGLISVDFRLFDPQPIDFVSLKRLLLPMLPGNEARFAAGATSLAQAVIDQPQVGTMVKVGEDVDVWCFITLLPWSVHTEQEFAAEMRRFLLSKCPSDLVPDLTSYLGGEKGRLSLLLSERMVNFPPELAPSVFASLLQDVSWARGQEQGAATGSSSSSSSSGSALDPEWILLLAPCFETTDGVVSYMHFEEELLAQSAVVSFDIYAPQSDATTTAAKPPPPVAQDASSSASSSSSSSSSSSASSSRKRTAEQREDAGAADGKADEEGDEAAGRAATRHLRRVLVFPAAVMEAAADGMTQLVAQARQADSK